MTATLYVHVKYSVSTYANTNIGTTLLRPQTKMYIVLLHARYYICMHEHFTNCDMVRTHL